MGAVRSVERLLSRQPLPARRESAAMNAEPANVLQLDAFRPRLTETLCCLFCGHVERRNVIAGQRYYDCRKCDETASIPDWQWRYGR
jgi:hypothetical protein